MCHLLKGACSSAITIHEQQQQRRKVETRSEDGHEPNCKEVWLGFNLPMVQWPTVALFNQKDIESHAIYLLVCSGESSQYP